MGRTLNLTFVVGFGLELGSVYALCLWPEIEHTAIPLAYVGGILMVCAVFIAIFRNPENTP